MIKTMSIAENIKKIKNSIPPNVTLVAVSKTKPVEAILEAYNVGQRDFGENKVQEMVAKYEVLPKDIKWHMIGHLQTNKVKYIAPFVYLIHGVDSIKLLKEINKRAAQNNRVIKCLIQVHIAKESTKFGFDLKEVEDLLNTNDIKAFKNVKIVGLMGMATFTENKDQIRNEFSALSNLFNRLKPHYPEFEILSIGMSGDYEIAIEEGSNMVRIGSSIFGERNY
ncbi:MAG: YggS family pyridoxal phosphate-dependent enzyme [Vicingaceae bacterium]